MEGNLVIVESPAKAKTIQKFLGKDYIVKSSFGHIRDLQEKKLSIDIDNGFKPEYVVPNDKKKVVADLKKAASSVQTVWLASDEDREGEAISWHLLETLELDPAKTKRIVFHEITKDAIVNAVKNPRTIDMNLVNAQQARRVLDRLVGFEMSPLLWRRIQRGLSAGRVQSVALRLVVDKEKEIMAFKPEPYYKVDAVFHPQELPANVKVKALLDTHFDSEAAARAFLERCIGARFTVDSVESKPATRFPAPPFTTSTLQQEASRRLRFPVSLTMRLAQSLYERGLITYMRTDSTNLSTLALGTAKQFIVDQFGQEYSHPRQFKTSSKGAQEAHEAIRPTYISNTEIEGTAQEKKLYELIWKRTVASQMADASVLNTSVKVSSDKGPEKFGLQSTVILFDGFMKVYIDEDSSDSTDTGLPEMRVGEILDCKEITASCKFSQAPARYSEATLVKKLEELGIGRPSTYAPTITTLTTGRGYIVKGDKEGKKETVTNLTLKNGTITSAQKTETVGAEKGKLLPQEIGMIVTDYLVSNFSEVLDYDFTANVEKDFDKVADGELAWNGVISDFYAPFHQRIDAVLEDRQFAQHVSRELGFAPDGDLLVAKFGQYGPYVQKGDASKRLFASLAKGQLVENVTLEDALKLFELPRSLGEIDGTAVTVLKGRFGPYIKFGDKNVSLPKGADPLKLTLEECRAIVAAVPEKAEAKPLLEFEASDIQVIEGRYGAYIKHAGSNYKLPKGTDPTKLTEEACKEIVNNSKPTQKKVNHRYKSGK